MSEVLYDVDVDVCMYVTLGSTLALLPAQQRGGVQPDISIKDPATDDFYLNIWMKCAQNNTQLYKQVLTDFTVIPFSACTQGGYNKWDVILLLLLLAKILLVFTYITYMCSTEKQVIIFDSIQNKLSIEFWWLLCRCLEET